MTGASIASLVLSLVPQGGQDASGFHSELASLRREHGNCWRALVDPQTGLAELLHGGHARLGRAPRDEVEAIELARTALDLARDLVGVEPATLAPARCLFLPLGQIGSGDKWTVRFAQRLSGLEVEGGHVNVLLDAQGRLLSVQSTAVPSADRLAELPTLAEGTALELARMWFAERNGLAPDALTAPRLCATRVLTAGRRGARAAFAVEARRAIEGDVPLGERYWIDAVDGALLRREPTVHDFDVTGTVVTLATPGTAPDGPANPATAQVLRHARVQSALGERTTDATGSFTYSGVSTPLAVTVAYYGTFNDVQDVSGPTYSLQAILQPDTPTTVVMNPAPTGAITAQANAMLGVNRVRDWIRRINPLDTTADLRFLSNVNLNLSCNAYFDGVSLNYFQAGGGCPNTSYSTVVAHELGHWLNVLYGTGNGSDGMGEGNADVFAMYCWDVPGVGEGFFGPGTVVRSGLNARQFCGDTSPGCYGEVHDDGEPWMGAAWKVRDRLNQTHGDALGDAIADELFLAWMNAYDQGLIRSIIEAQWLTLDDDDGVLENGTPHYTDIDAGFRDQGFPGVPLVPLAISDVTLLPDTQDAHGPYAVDARIAAHADPPLLATTLRWRVNGGAWNDQPMNAQGGGVYRATIPGQAFPALVQYYVRATDSALRIATWPSSAPDQAQAFDVGTLHALGDWDFDGATPAGWTSGAVGDAPNPESDWERGIPQGRSGTALGTSWRDPPAAHSGLYAFANDLGTASSDGAYSADVHSYLRSPVLNCSAAQHTRLRFQSWLSVDGSASDQARVLVNGVEFYANPALSRSDAGWGMQEYDISSVADGNPAVRVEFRLRSDGAGHFGGWALDDVEVFWLSLIVPPCPSPASYCSTSPNSVGGGALLDWSGSGNLVLNDLRLHVANCPPGTTGQFYYGANQTQVPFGNGFRCVAGTVFRLGAQVTDVFGDASRQLDLFSLPSGGALPGQVWNFQFWYRNPAAGGAGFNLSDGLSVTICD